MHDYRQICFTIFRICAVTLIGKSLNMEKLIAFGTISILLVLLSGKSIFKFRSHGFYRFLSWECIAWLLVSNFKYWFDNPLGGKQICSWILLSISIYLVIAGVILLKKIGKPTDSRSDESLFTFEKTSTLVCSGIFKYIRHPLYSSLLFLTWGILLKNLTFPLICFAALSSVFLYLTAIYDEKECVSYFGKRYLSYMNKTKMFIPFLF